MSFEFLEHTADVRAECRGATFAELLEAAANALYALALEKRSAQSQEAKRPTINKSIEIVADNREELLVGWLQELIFLLDVERFVAVDYSFSESCVPHLRAELRGYRCNTDELGEEVKGATYHGLEVRESPRGFVARVVFDL